MTDKLETVADYEIRKRFQILADQSTDQYVMSVFVGGNFELTMTHQGKEVRAADESLLGALDALYARTQPVG